MAPPRLVIAALYTLHNIRGGPSELCGKGRGGGVFALMLCLQTAAVCGEVPYFRAGDSSVKARTRNRRQTYQAPALAELEFLETLHYSNSTLWRHQISKSSSAWAEASRRDPYVDSPLAVTLMYSVLRPYYCSRTVLGGFDGTGAGLAGSRGSAVR